MIWGAPYSRKEKEMTALFAVLLVLLCALFLGIGLLLKGKNPFSCKRCSTPEKKECDLCGKKDHSPSKISEDKDSN